MMDIERIKVLEKDIERLEAEWSGLLERYGSGVRPSWVSTDLSMVGQMIRNRQAEIAEIKGSKP